MVRGAPISAGSSWGTSSSVHRFRWAKADGRGERHGHAAVYLLLQAGPLHFPGPPAAPGGEAPGSLGSKDPALRAAKEQVRITAGKVTSLGLDSTAPDILHPPLDSLSLVPRSSLSASMQQAGAVPGQGLLRG